MAGIDKRITRSLYEIPVYPSIYPVSERSPGISYDIVWLISTCPSFKRWDIEFAFDDSIFPQCAAFAKLNISNWIWLCHSLKTIFPSWMSKSFKGPFMTEYDQRAIIRFLSNDGIAPTKLPRDFRHSLLSMRTNLELFDSELVRWGAIRSSRPPWRNSHWKASSWWSRCQNFGNFKKSPFESARSISERLRVSPTAMLNHLHLSIGFKSFHLHWVLHLLTNDFCQKKEGDARVMLPLLHAA
jgi:hypothetical protein